MVGSGSCPPISGPALAAHGPDSGRRRGPQVDGHGASLFPASRMEGVGGPRVGGWNSSPAVGAPQAVRTPCFTPRGN